MNFSKHYLIPHNDLLTPDSLICNSFSDMKYLSLIGFKYAFHGINAAFSTEINFRIELLISLAIVISGWLIGLSQTEWCLIIFCISLVLITELLNTAIEKSMNLLHPEIHPLVKTIKDVSAAAVLISALSSAIIGGIIFVPKLLFLLY